MTSKGWTVSISDEEYFGMSDHTEYIYEWDIIRRIILRSTVKNPVKFNEIMYECQVSGTGEQQHFGSVRILILCSVIPGSKHNL